MLFSIIEALMSGEYPLKGKIVFKASCESEENFGKDWLVWLSFRICVNAQHSVHTLLLLFSPEKMDCIPWLSLI